MGIEKTKYGTWRARWRDDTGTQRAQTFKRRDDARAFLTSTLADLQRGTYIAPKASAITVTDWSTEWLASAMNLGQGGKDTYRRDLDRYILPELGDLTLKKLTAGAIDEFLSDELERLAPSTVHRHYRTIRRMAQVAVDRGRLARNPCDQVTPPRLQPAEMRFLDVAQVAALAGAITPRYRAWVNVAAYGGLRWSESIGLRRSRVDGARVTVAEQMIRRADRQWHRDVPKTRAGVRTITMPGFVADELTAHLDEWARPGADGLVFPNRNGNPLNASSFRTSTFMPAVAKAGIEPGLRIHDLRHTAVALAIAAGAHPKAIQARMGHASITMTLDRYGHLFPEMDEQLAEGLQLLHVNGGVRPRLAIVS